MMRLFLTFAAMLALGAAAPAFAAQDQAPSAESEKRAGTPGAPVEGKAGTLAALCTPQPSFPALGEGDTGLELFRTLDDDNDATLSREEYAQACGETARQDGKVLADEQLRRQFAALDGDGDGSLDYSELAAQATGSSAAAQRTARSDRRASEQAQERAVIVLDERWQRALGHRLPNEVVGMGVRTSGGKEVGTVADVVFSDAGEALAVISLGASARADKDVAVPVEDLQVSAQDERILMMSETSADEIAEMPAYRQQHKSAPQDPAAYEMRM